MYKLKIGALIVILFAQMAASFLLPSQARAVGSTTIVISQVQAGVVGGATQEFVALFNNSDADVDVTGWCLTNKSAIKFACVPVIPNVAVFIHARGYMTISSDTFSTANNYQPDITFTTTNQSSGGIVGGGDTITLSDAGNSAIDAISWSTSLAAGSLFQRQETSPGSGYLVDTDSPADFIKLTTLVIPTSGVYEVETVIDVCPNIVDIQTILPEGLVIDGNGDCVILPPVDMCPNIDDIQIVVPDGFLQDVTGDCLQDICANIDGLQATMPSDYESLDGMTCTTIPAISDMIEITELLPNPAGSDTGNEFIELHNPHSHAVNLKGYQLLIGPNFDKSYVIPELTLGPRQYVALTNAEIAYTLVNSSSRARLVAPAGNIVSDTPTYSTPADGESWALIDGIWQYTNQPTPGSANVGSEYDEIETAGVAGVAPCAEGKYRHPLTNRCRNIESDISVLSTCDTDQYRNPETGRCRKITLATALTPCKDGQYRSEETNRCRNISTASATLAPCKEGQERNPATNRCRNVTSSTVPAAAFAIESTKQGSEVFVGWWALASVGALALGYGVWEWRFELASLARRAASIVMRKQ